MAQSSTKYISYPPSLGNEVKQGQHYILFNSYESKSAISAEGLMKSSIALYIPPNSLSTSISQNYGEVQGGTTMATTSAGMGKLQDIISGEGGYGWSSLTDAMNLGGAALDGAGDLIKGAMTKQQKIQDFMSSAFGLARNNHVALAYKGPGQFRTHNFTFQFFPKNKDEANDVREIIKDFQDGSTPRMVGGKKKETITRLTAPYFASPRQWDIKFIMGAKTGMNEGGSDNTYLHQLKRSVITSIAINHDPDSVVSFHEDGSPVHSSMTLAFQEIEYVLSGDSVSEEFNESISKLENQRIQQERVEATQAMVKEGNALPPHLR